MEEVLAKLTVCLDDYSNTKSWVQFTRNAWANKL